MEYEKIFYPTGRSLEKKNYFIKFVFLFLSMIPKIYFDPLVALKLNDPSILRGPPNSTYG